MSPGLLAPWAERRAAPLHGRDSRRMARLVVGVAPAQGRRTAKRRARPWDTPRRRPSPGGRRKALRRELMKGRSRHWGARGRGVRRPRGAFRAVVKLVA